MSRSITGVYLLVSLVAGPATAVDTADTRARLKELGLGVSGGRIILAAESDFIRDVGKAADPQRKLRLSSAAVQKHEMEMRQLGATIEQLRLQAVELNAKLAGGAADNRTIGMINALQGQIELLSGRRDKAAEEGRAMRSELNKIREDYAERMLELRATADRIEADYATKGAEEAIREAVAAAAAADGRSYSFGPGPGLQAALKKLRTFEDMIFSDTIELDRRGSVLIASTVINGEHVQPMMVDSGCSSLLVPHNLAERFNVLPGEYDQKVTCTLADGSTVQGHLKKLRSVRVGRFVVDDVECVVLGPEAVAAEPLLGMSFLGKFEFKLDPDAGTIEMLKVGPPD